MKNWLFLLLAFGLFATACEQEQFSSRIDAQLEDAVDIQTGDLTGDWQVASYIDDDGDDDTYYFDGFSISFTSDRDVEIYRNGNLVLSGSYRLRYNDQVLDISLPDDNDPLDDLDEEWVVLRQTNNEIWLREFDDDDDDEDDDDRDELRLVRL